MEFYNKDNTMFCKMETNLHVILYSTDYSWGHRSYDSSIIVGYDFVFVAVGC